MSASVIAGYKLLSKLLVIMWSITVEDISVTPVDLVIRGMAPLLIIVLIYSNRYSSACNGTKQTCIICRDFEVSS